ncbi:TetR/AcrR family transcriptional regulator [Roseomonas sp. BN140053]|uniref:TetR/AcrR family transcriptional regulator n=1 Tax=Roseomonas sp. BN140053 TaxID=3391898 RepID=UPI0039ED7911
MTREAPPAPTRERIRQVAADLYVLRGHDGFSFGDVAAAIGTTRANIHHHYGNKHRLMAELLDGFAGDAEARIMQHWARPGVPFAQRFHLQREDLRRFYHHFNRQPGDRNVWSPLSRLRLDMPVLGEAAMVALERVNRSYETCLKQALAEAVAVGSFSPEIAAEDVVGLLRGTFLSCGPMTQDSGSFAEVERVLGALERMLNAAWGRGPAQDR